LSPSISLIKYAVRRLHISPEDRQDVVQSLFLASLEGKQAIDLYWEAKRLASDIMHTVNECEPDTSVGEITSVLIDIKKTIDQLGVTELGKKALTDLMFGDSIQEIADRYDTSPNTIRDLRHRFAICWRSN
jgi:hypothetical protein